MSDAFDPDKYLAEKAGSGASGDFDPDAYLKEKTTAFAPPAPEGRSPLRHVGEEISGLLGGKGIVERIPVVGPALDNIGTGLAAAARAPFSDKSWGDIYSEIKKDKEDDEARWAQRAPIATGLKNLTAGAALPPVAKGAGLLAEGANTLGQAGLSWADTVLRTGRVTDANEAGETAGILGAASSILPRALSAGGMVAARGMTGVKKDLVDYYRANRNAVNAADRDELTRAGRAVIEDLRSAETGQRQSLSDYIGKLQDEIRGDATKASHAAMDHLQASDATIPARGLKAYPRFMANQKKIGNANYQGDGAAALEAERQFLEATGLKEFRPEDVKRYMQRLDEKLAGAYQRRRTGGDVSEAERALMDFRSYLDKRLKGDGKRPGIPGYEEAMLPVSGRMSALGAAERHFPTPDRTYGALERIDNPANQGARDALEGLFPWQSSARDLVGEARDINAMNAPIRGMGPDSFETLAQRVTGKKPKLRDREAFDFIAEKAKELPESRVPIQDFQKYAKDLGVQEAFQSPFVHGSRNVNLGASVLGGIGHMASGLAKHAGPIGVAIGGAIGAAADKIGPQTVKRIIDAVDSPGGQAWAEAYRAAARRGPTAIAVTHEMLKRTDERYRRLMEAQGEGAP